MGHALGLYWHAHFDEFVVGAQVEEPFENAIQFLIALVREQVIFVEWSCGRQYLGSRVQHRGEQSPNLALVGTAWHEW